ncbi:hypothetical protein MHYP_G00178680 [Metynnis hypsauchen]
MAEAEAGGGHWHCPHGSLSLRGASPSATVTPGTPCAQPGAVQVLKSPLMHPPWIRRARNTRSALACASVQPPQRLLLHQVRLRVRVRFCLPDEMYPRDNLHRAHLSDHLTVDPNAERLPGYPRSFLHPTSSSSSSGASNKGGKRDDVLLSMSIGSLQQARAAHLDKQRQLTEELLHSGGSKR